MECDLCGTVNRASARFCGGCGSALARRCPSCKAELDAGLSFCDQCGTTLDAAATSSPPPTAATPAPAGAVRKTVTVLFADLGGSTGFGERTDPEISRQVLARYHALLQETVDAHGGTVAKFMGDGMMATFGIPEVAEDDARRAVEAGTDTQRRFEAFAADVLARYGETLTLRVGINTGEVVIASGDADLVGDALNVAARLEKACRPGHVLVGDETWRITRGALAYEPLGEVTVAGRAGPVSTYEVIGTGAATAEPVAPFVGRVGETARLRAAFDRACVDKEAVLVTVLGSPGMGKTRLSRELASTLAAYEEATTFEIRCDRSGGATFAPFADLVREAAGIAEIEDGEDAAELTRDRIGALVRDDGDRGRVVDVIAGVLGAAPARSVEETFWGVRRLVESLATDHPLVVVIDDIQWAEPKLLDLLEHLAEWVHAAAVLLVCLARPELRELRPSLTEPGRRVADVLALDGLDASATAELASGLLGSALPGELVDRLPVSTDGNPLFVRELVRMLVDDAVIRRRDDGAWELAIDAEAIEVPPTIQSLLATRVERLPTEELRVLELASVVGAEFSVGALRELAGDDIAVPPVLERLRRKELVEPTGSYWGDDPLHRFHHVLIRDAAYRRLLKTTRADLHQRVGEWTDSITSDLVGEQETGIAFHYEQAHRYRMELGTADDETDRLGRRAAELLTVAARRALDREDLTSAGALARRALAALPAADVDDRAELLLIACECLLSSGDVTAGAPLVDALDALSDDNEQLGAWAACYRAQLIGLTDPDGVVAAEGMASAAATVLANLADGAGEAKAHQVRALLLARLGRVGEAEVVLDLALGAARASDDRRRVTAVLGAAPQAALFGPSPVARAGGRCLDVVRLLRITTASPSVEATSMRCQAVLEALRGRFDVSRSMLASARASLEELGLRHGLLETDLFTGMVELIAGDPGAAIDPLRSAYEGLDTLGVGADAGQAAALLATALLARGEIDDAELMAGESEALAGQNLKTAIAWRIARAEVHAARGDTAAGVFLAEQAVEIAAGTDLILDHADACVVLADLRDAAGDPAGARVARADALRLYEAKGATVPAGRLSDAGSKGEAPVQPPVRAPEPVAPGRDADTRTAAAANAASRFLEQLRVALNAGDYEAAGRLTADGYVFEDRRSIVAVPDVEALTSDTQAATAQGFVILEPEVIAVRGERLCLRRLVYRTPAGDESPRLVLDETDRDGRLARSVFFDDDDLVTAVAELDRSYYLGEGAPFQRVLAAVGRYRAAVDSHDLDQARDRLAPDFVMVDHQPLGFGAGDRDYYLEWTRTDDDGISGFNAVMFVNDHGLLGVYRQNPVTSEGNRYERGGCIVLGVDASDRVNRFEMFAADDFAAALARFDGLGAGEPVDPRTPLVENAASRFMEPLRVAFNGKDREALWRLIAPDYVHEDRRSIVASVGLDPRGRLEELAATIDQGFVFAEPVVIAVRGERLALSRMVARTPAGDESARLSLNEIGTDGRMTRSVLFDEEGVTAALAELDRSYYFGEGAPFQRVLDAVGRYSAGYERNDLDEVRAQLAADLVMVDHRPIGFGTGGRDLFVEMSRAEYTEGRGVNRVVYAHQQALLAMNSQTVISNEDSRYEWSSCTVLGIDASGRISCVEMFADDQFTAALTRFDELAAGVSGPSEPAAENAATAVMSRVIDLCHERRFDDVRALLTDDFVREDRRHGVAAPTADGPDEFIRAYAAWFDVGFDTLTMEPLAIRGDHLVLAHLEWRSPDGRQVGFLALYELAADGRFVRGVHFDEDDGVAAVAELSARWALWSDEHRSQVDARSGTVTNEAAEATSIGIAVMNLDPSRAGSVAEEFVAGGGISPDVRRDDRRRLVASPVTVDGDGWAAEVGAIFSLFDRIEVEPVAVRGERVALMRLRCVQDPDFQSSWLAIYEYDDEGRLVLEVDFDESDLDAALDELDERYYAGEGAEHAEMGALAAGWVRTFRGRDWDAYPAVLADDFVAVSHFQFGFELGAGDYIDWLRASREQMPELTTVLSRLEIVGRAILASRAVAGTTPEGNRYEWRLHLLSVADADGRLLRHEYFEDDQYAMALARLHELGAEPPVGTAPENATTRLIARTLDLMNRGEWDELVAMNVAADDVVRFDRRRTVSAPTLSDSESFGANAVGIYEVFGTVRPETVAVRGERLALIRLHCGEAPAFTMEMLVVYELDDDGRIVREADFDDGDLDAALDELDERFIAGDGAEHEYLISRIGDFRHARAARNWDALEELFAEDYVAVDRRPLGLGAGTRSGYLAASRAMVDLVPDATFVPRAIEVSTDVVLMRTAGSGTSVDGSRSEWEQWVVWRFAAGRAVCGEVFSLEDEPAARARFAELAAQTLTPYIDNHLVRLSERGRWLDRYSDDVVALFSDDCVLDDRRPAVNEGVVSGGDAVADSVRSGEDAIGVLETEPLAVRGARLALIQWSFVAEGGFESPGLSVMELDDADRVCRITSFDESDLADAIDFLEARHAEMQGEALTRIEALAAAGEDALNHRDFEAFAALLSPDFTIEDHQRFGVPMTRESYLESLRVLIEQAPDFTFVFAKLIVVGDCALAVVPFWGTTPEGSRYEWSYFQVARVDAEGRALRFEFFPDDRWDNAVVRFERWTAGTAPDAQPVDAPVLHNRCVQVHDRFGELLFSGDVHGARECMAPDLLAIDRRRGVAAPDQVGPDARLANLAAVTDVFGHLEAEPAAVRGDRLMLLHWTIQTDAGFVATGYDVTEIDADDRLARVVTFEEDDLDAALDTLDERYIAGEGAEHDDVIRWWREFGAAYRDRDWDALEDRYAPDAVLVDHRSIGQGWTNRADFLTSTRAVVELVPDVQHLPRRLEIRGRVTLTDGEAFGTTADGSRYSWGYHLLAQWAGGRITRLEIFDVEESVAARARFDELASETAEPDPENAAARLIVDASRLLWTDLDAALDRFSPEAIGVARESGPSLGLSAENREMWRDVLGSLAQTYDDVRYETLAVRGDRLALLRQEFVRDGYVTPALLMVELDDQDRILRLETFAEEDLPAVIEELDRRSVELLGEAPDGPIPGPSAKQDAQGNPVSRAFAARDWELTRSRVAPDAVLEDRRSTVNSHRAVGADAVVDLFRGWAEVGFETLDNIHLAARGEHLALLRRVFRTATGFEIQTLVVVETQTDGLMASITLFDADALVPALDELEIRYARSGAMSRTERSLLVGFAALNHRRWSEFDTLFSSDLEVVDHRRLGFPPATGPGDLVHALQSLVAQVPDVVAIVQDLEISGSAALASVQQLGTSIDGTTADWGWRNVVSIDGAGRIRRLEYVDIDDDARARARFEELGRRDV